MVVHLVVYFVSFVFSFHFERAPATGEVTTEELFSAGWMIAVQAS